MKYEKDKNVFQTKKIMLFFICTLIFSCSNSGLLTNSIKGVDRDIIHGYSFINPLLDYGIEYKERNALYIKINSYIKKQEKCKKLTSATVYFRNLNNGYWFSINENEKYCPASLLKVVTAINILKYSEYYPGILNDSIKITKRYSNIKRDTLRMPKEISIGEKYSIRDLIERTIINSDNESNNVLFDYIQTKFDWNIALNLLNIELEEDKEYFAAYITAKDYSKLFRVLYNSTFLNQENSEYLLFLLSKSFYNRGITSNINSRTTVAHKYGQLRKDANGLKHLHDCGIVYFPDNPYLLCVMTKGDDFNELETVISDISDIIYNQVKTQLSIISKK